MPATTTRRKLLAAAAAAPLAAISPRANAAAPMLGAARPLFNRFKLGSFEVTTLLSATNTAKDPHKFFGTNVSDEEFQRAADANFIPADRLQFFFTPTVVNTGTELVLFDTGLNTGAITSALGAAGYTPEQVDKVVITHMHGDHIGGLSADGQPTFANASYVTGAVEYDYWAGTESKAFTGKVKPLANQMSFLQDGGSAAPGITAVMAAGHTPGHMGYMLESDGQQLLIGADFANHYVWSLAYPEWEMRFDMDKAMAAQTRRRLLDMLSADRVPFIGYHMPFPSLGYVEKGDEAFRYVAASYQMMM